MDKDYKPESDSSFLAKMNKEQYQVGQIVDYKGEWYIIDSIIGEGGGVYKEDEGLKSIFNGEKYDWVDDSLIKPAVLNRLPNTFAVLNDGSKEFEVVTNYMNEIEPERSISWIEFMDRDTIGMYAIFRDKEVTCGNNDHIGKTIPVLSIEDFKDYFK